MPMPNSASSTAHSTTRHRPGVDDVVAQREDRLAHPAQPGALQPPGVAQRCRRRCAAGRPRTSRRAGSRPGSSGVATRTWWPRLCSMKKWPYPVGRQGDAREPALQVLLLVAEFVRGVDGDPVHRPDRERDAELVDDAETAVVGDQPESDEERHELQRQEQVGHPAVVAVLLQPGHDRLGRVARIGAEEQVERRDEHVEPQRPHPPEQAEPGDVHQSPAGEQEHRHHGAEQPQVPLAVAPVGALVGDNHRSTGQRSSRIAHHPRARRQSARAPPVALHDSAICKATTQGGI